MVSKRISKELQEKYGLPEDVVEDSVSMAITRALTLAMRATIFVTPGDDGLEIHALRRNSSADPYRVRPSSIKPKVLRAIQYEIEKELYARKVATELDRYHFLQSQVLQGRVVKVHNDGRLDIEIEQTNLFNQEILLAVCEKEGQPIHERGKFKVDSFHPFYVHTLKPENVRGMFRLKIVLSRNSPRLTEGLIRKEIQSRALGLSSEANQFKCIKRICGSFSQIVAEKRIEKDIIKSVTKELQENVYVKYGVTFGGAPA